MRETTAQLYIETLVVLGRRFLYLVTPISLFFIFATKQQGMPKEALEVNDAKALEAARRKFGFAKLKARLKKTREGARTTAKGCLLLTRLKPAAKGYYRITVAESSDTSNSTRVMVHHLVKACAAGDRPFVLKTYPAEKDWEEVSHLCNNKNCMTPEHLHVERHSVNLTRLCCAMFLGKKEGYTCPHDPHSCI